MEHPPQVSLSAFWKLRVIIKNLDHYYLMVFPQKESQLRYKPWGQSIAAYSAGLNPSNEAQILLINDLCPPQTAMSFFPIHIPYSIDSYDFIQNFHSKFCIIIPPPLKYLINIYISASNRDIIIPHLQIKSIAIRILHDLLMKHPESIHPARKFSDRNQ